MIPAGHPQAFVAQAGGLLNEGPLVGARKPQARVDAYSCFHTALMLKRPAFRPMLPSGFTVSVTAGFNRVRHMGLVARFSIVGLTVGVLVAGTMAWFIETQLTDLLLTNVAARASDQVERLGLTGYITQADFTPPYTPELPRRIAAADRYFADFEH